MKDPQRAPRYARERAFPKFHPMSLVSRLFTCGRTWRGLLRLRGGNFPKDIALPCRCGAQRRRRPPRRAGRAGRAHLEVHPHGVRVRPVHVPFLHHRAGKAPRLDERLDLVDVPRLPPHELVARHEDDLEPSEGGVGLELFELLREGEGERTGVHGPVSAHNYRGARHAPFVRRAAGPTQVAPSLAGLRAGRAA